jgi:FlgD Ig-like domain
VNRIMNLRSLAVAALVAAMLVAPGVSLAVWLEDPSINLQVSATPGNESGVTSVPDGKGGMLVLWVHTGHDEVYVQRVTAAGIPVWPLPVPVSLGNEERRDARAVPDGAGGVIVVWIEGDAGALFDLRAQRIDEDGVRLWGSEGMPVCEATGSQYQATLIPIGVGGAIVTWSDYRSGNYDIYAQRLDASGTSQWTQDGVGLCTASGSQSEPAMVTDSAGGVVIAWTDARSGSGDIYVQRVSSSGTTLWAAGGVPLTVAAGVQRYPALVGDFVGGAVVAWMDQRADGGDVYAQRISPDGTIPWPIVGVPVCTAAGTQSGISMIGTGSSTVISWTDERSGASNKDIYAQRVSSLGTVLWSPNGLPVCTASGNQITHSGQSVQQALVHDGWNGVILAWSDYRLGTTSDLYAQRLDPAGAAMWSVNGVAVSTANGDQSGAVPVPGGDDGAIFAWLDYRDGSPDVYTQRVRSGGELGNTPPPVIVRIHDIPNDQGGKVQVEWGASSKDYGPGFVISGYSVWRRVPNAPTVAGVASVLPDPLGVAPSGRARIRTSGASGQALYWEHVATLPARGFPGYSYTAETTSDSLGGSNPCTHFMVLAEEAGGTPFYGSASDSGYSVDNLAPASPSPVGGQYTAGSIHIHWSRNGESDLSGYRVYKGSNGSFEPGPANLVGSTSDTLYVDEGPVGSYYKLTAVDVHGNESLTSLLSPAQISAVEPAEPVGAIRFGLPSPNPSRGAVSFRIVLPRDASVRFSVYDVQGRSVTSRPASTLSSGQHTFGWDGRGRGGESCGAGVYYARLEVDGAVVGTQRITILR